MSLVGTYVCNAIPAKLIVTEANDANGQAKGVMEFGDGIVIHVQMHYHYKNNVGPDTDLWFAGNNDDPNQYVAGVGITNNQGFPKIEIAGGFPLENGVQAFHDTFVRA